MEQQLYTGGQAIYRLRAPDGALPSFMDDRMVNYYGTREDFLAALSARPGLSGPWRVAVESYFRGGAREAGDGFIVQVELLNHVHLEPSPPFSHTHRNIWNQPYELLARQMEGELFYIREEYGDLLRCVRLTFTGLQCGTEKAGPYRPLRAEMCWGFPGMMAENDRGELFNRLLYVDQLFLSEEDYLADQQEPDEIVFGGFFDGIFGDG